MEIGSHFDIINSSTNIPGGKSNESIQEEIVKLNYKVDQSKIIRQALDIVEPGESCNFLNFNPDDLKLLHSEIVEHVSKMTLSVEEDEAYKKMYNASVEENHLLKEENNVLKEENSILKEENNILKEQTENLKKYIEDLKKKL